MRSSLFCRLLEVTVTALVTALATPAFATDGVLEINQTCALSGGCFSGDASGYPVEITQPGSYRLTSNLDIRGLPSPQDITVVLLKSNDVSLDLNGFSILGAASCSGTPTACTGAGTGVGVLAPTTESVSSFSLRNGTIRGMGSNGVQLESTAEGEGYHLSDLRVVSNAARGIRFNAQRSSLITNCVIERNGTFGISLVGGGSGVISNNVVSRNGSAGVNAPGYLVSGNEITQNQFAGLNGFGGGYVGNVFTGNSPDVSGGTQLGPNLCSGALCP